MHTTVLFRTDLGATVHVAVEADSERNLRRVIIDTQRSLGALGWRANDFVAGPQHMSMPIGGFEFPLANEPNFDWAILGGRRGTKRFENEGEPREGVWLDDEFYSRREYAAEDAVRGKPGKPAAVRYSRGALKTDPPEYVENGEGDFKYVTLAFFRGDRQKIVMYETRSAPRRTPGSRSKAPPPEAVEETATPVAPSVVDSSASTGSVAPEPPEAPAATTNPTPAAPEPPAPTAEPLPPHLEDTPANLELLVGYIKANAQAFNPKSTTVEIDGKSQLLTAFATAPGNWARIKQEFAVALRAARAIQQATGRPIVERSPV